MSVCRPVSLLGFLIHCLLSRIPYTLSPLSSSLYTVSSLIFLPTPCFVPGLFFRLFAAFCCSFLVRFSVCLLLSVVCSWFVFQSVCCFLWFVPGLFFRLFAAFCCLLVVSGQAEPALPPQRPVLALPFAVCFATTTKLRQAN